MFLEPAFPVSPIYIPLDGSGVCTAPIAFAQGISIPQDEIIKLGPDINGAYFQLGLFDFFGSPGVLGTAALTSSGPGISIGFQAGGASSSAEAGGDSSLIGGDANGATGNGGYALLRGGQTLGSGAGGRALLSGGGSASGNNGYVSVGVGTPSFSLTSIDAASSLYVNKAIEAGTTLKVGGATTLATSLTGILKATSGVVATASSSDLLTAIGTIDISANTNLAVDSGELTLTGDSLGLATTAVTPGSYTATNLTVDAFGRITAAANGSAGSTYTGTSPIDVTGTVISFDFSVNNSWNGTNTFHDQVYADLDPSDATAVGSSVVINPEMTDTNDAALFVGNTNNALFTVTGKSVNTYQVLNVLAGMTIDGLTDGYLTVTGDVVGSTTTVIPDLTANYTWTGSHIFDKSISVTPTLDEYSNFGTPSSAIAVSDAVDRFVVSKIVTGSSTGAARGAVIVADYSYTAGAVTVTGAIQGLNAFAVTNASSTSDFTATGTQGGGLRAGRYSVNHAGSGLVAQGSGITSGFNGTGPMTDAFNYHAEMNLSAAADIDRLGGLWIRTPVDSATLDAVYGIRINAFTGLTTTNLYPIAIDGTAKHIFFNAPTQLTEWIGSESTDHLDFGADTHIDFNVGGTERFNASPSTLTFSDAYNIALNTTTGTKIGTATTQKLAFFNATPIIQQANTADLKDVIAGFGFMVNGGASPLNLDGGALTAGNISSSALTAGRFTYYSGGVLADDSDATFDGVNAIFTRLHGRIGYQSGGASARVPMVLIRSNTQVGNASGGAASTLWSETIAADTLEFDGDYIKYEASGTFAATADPKQITVTLGSTTIYDSGSLAITAAGDWHIQGLIYRTAANTQKNVATLTASNLGTITPPVDYTTSAETDSGSLTFALKGAGTNTNDIVFQVGIGMYGPQSA